MDRNRMLHPRTRELPQDTPPQEPEESSPVLEAARGWARIARDVSGRLETDDAREFLETARRNGPGQ